MDEMEFLRKLGQCEDKEQIQRCIEDYNNGQKPMTNADRIRAMSDEELAKLLCGGVKGFDCQSCRIGDQRKCDMECEDHCKIWLQQPAEVSDNA